ncbi:FAD/NAD(P)-binding domain-containing protein [Rhizoclosmatium globosum]|uniref:FAD/NAD(P)-binding domain-containing protein n=1 Tax=Rhizoclosmatium globosum TaxID=329046 RepID=A0A1Y2CIW6_9FUNG|nr:FAD/NAD(P)-binding domain-containing protein [Rhizoclosmatium globosum]|eukprot:ORY46972.1 FAD/NAD(P)-binding domain-containing protein [Rhizoclosmatium globosum]
MHLLSTTTIQGIKELTTTTHILSLLLSSLTLYATAHATSNLITEAKEAALPATDATRFLITSSVEAYKYFTRLTPSSTSTTRVNEDVVLGTVVVWALSLSLIIPTLGGLRKWVGGGGTSAGFAVGSKVFWGVSSGSGSDSVVGERALTDSTLFYDYLRKKTANSNLTTLIYPQFNQQFDSMGGKTVAIIGSGPAGALAALALQKQGFEPTLYDKVDPIEVLKETLRTGVPLGIRFGDNGGGLSIMGNGSKALAHMGLLDLFKQSEDKFASDPNNFMLIDGSVSVLVLNTIVGSLNKPFKPFKPNQDRITRSPAKIKPIRLLRSGLHATLMKAVSSAGIKTFGAKKLKSLIQSETNVTVTFEDGSVVVADFVVGADGIHSMTRRLVFPDAPPPTLFGAGFVGIVDLSANLNHLDFDSNGGIYSDPLNARLVFASLCGDKDGEVFVVELDSAKRLEQADDWREFADLQREAGKVADLVASWGAAPVLVESLRRARRITPANLYDLPDIQSFHKGRVVLVGDSAHGTVPFYGQGLNQAIEDVGVLYDLFGHFKETDYKTAFSVYDQIRVPRTRICSAEARKVASRMKASSNMDLKIGRFMMKLVFKIINFFRLDDEVYYHDYRDDIRKVVPNVKFD